MRATNMNGANDYNDALATAVLTGKMPSGYNLNNLLLWDTCDQIDVRALNHCIEFVPNPADSNPDDYDVAEFDSWE